VELGDEYFVALGDPTARGADASERKGRIVWLQEEPDGFVVGIEYLSLSGTHPAAAPVSAEGVSAEAASAEGRGAVDASGVSPAASADANVTEPEGEA
jgi:hypothetical protein